MLAVLDNSSPPPFWPSNTSCSNSNSNSILHPFFFKTLISPSLSQSQIKSLSWFYFFFRSASLLTRLCMPPNSLLFWSSSLRFRLLNCKIYVPLDLLDKFSNFKLCVFWFYVASYAENHMEILCFLWLVGKSSWFFTFWTLCPKDQIFWLYYLSWACKLP